MRAAAVGAAASASSRAAALADLSRDKVAASAAGPRDSLLRTWEEFHRLWHADATAADGVETPAFPLTEAKLDGVVAMLKAGRYRSAEQYIARAKDRHIELHYPWTDALARAAGRAGRSAVRGIGPARQSHPLPMRAAVKLRLPSAPLVAGGPTGPGRLVEAGSLFCVRELEGSLALRTHVTFDRVARTVTWLLPCSKTDPAALGKKRTWGCVCTAASPSRDRSAPCAYCALLEQSEFLDSEFPGRTGLPLFPDYQGAVVAKERVVATFERIAQICGEQVTDEQGNRRYGGHSLRVTGAQWLASLGVPLISIQLMARWASDVVAKYVGESPLARVTEEYRRRNEGLDLEALMANAQEKLHMLEGRVGALDAHAARALDDERRLREQIEASPPAGAKRGAPFVVREPRGKWHIPACSHYPDLPAFQWRAKCGWHFGLARFRCEQSLSSEAVLCRGCLPEGAQGDEQSDGE